MTVDIEQLALPGDDWPTLTPAQENVEYLVGRALAQLDADWPRRIKDHRELYGEMSGYVLDRAEEQHVIQTLVREQIEKWVDSLPPEFRGASYLKLDAEAQHAVKLQRWPDAANVPTLWLAGQAGNGKTYCAHAVAGDQVVRSLGHYSRLGYPVITNTVDMLDGLKPSADDHEKLWNRVKQASLLILDDLGAARPTDWSLERLYALADYRSRTQRRTLITVNKTMAELEQTWGGPIIDRFILNSGVLSFKGKSRRGFVNDW